MKQIKFNGTVKIGGVVVPVELLGDYDITDYAGPIPTPTPVPPSFPATPRTIFELPASAAYLTPNNIGNNVGANIKVVNVGGKDVLEFSLQHNGTLNPNGTGARVFIPWGLLKGYVGQTIELVYAKFMPEILKPVGGGDKFLGFGAQSKYGSETVIWALDADYSPAQERLSPWVYYPFPKTAHNAVIKPVTPVYYLPGKWLTDLVQIKLSTEADGYLKYWLDGQFVLSFSGPTCGPNGAGVGLALYTNAITTPISALFTGMRVDTLG